jgi:hypothetical protein
MNPGISSSSTNREIFPTNNLRRKIWKMADPGDLYNPDEVSSPDATENLHRKQSQRKHKERHHSRRNSRKGSRRTFWHGMYKEFLAAKPGTNFQDQGTKDATYTCQHKDSLHAEYLLPRKNNAVVELSKWHKKSVNLLNTQYLRLVEFIRFQLKCLWNS